MAFDFAWGFRATEGHVTDPTFQDFADNQNYPVTFTNVDGLSINAGWSGFVNVTNGDGTNDPRIGGCCFDDGVTRDFRVDLSSGSAPGAGTYDVDIALGFTNGQMQAAEIKDDTSVVIDLTNGGSGYSTDPDHYIDATGTDILATGSWTGTPVTQAFATTTVLVTLRQDLTASGVVTLSHFRLTLQEGGAAIFTQDHIGRGIGRGIFAGR